MRVFRFDPEVSIPIDHFGSQFRIGPLTGPDARVRAQGGSGFPPDSAVFANVSVVRKPAPSDQAHTR